MSKKIIDTIFIKIVDKYNIDEQFDFDDDITILLRGKLESKETKDNEDGSCNLIMKFKALDCKVNKNL